MADEYSDDIILRLYANDLVDSSNDPKTLTAVPGSGTAGISTTGRGDGAGSFYVSGGGTILINDASALALGTGDFTVEFWAKMNTANSYGVALVLGGYNTNVGIYFGFYCSGETCSVKMGTLSPAASTPINVTKTVASLQGDFHHFAAVRASGTLKLYMDGVSLGSSTFTGGISSPGKLRIGCLNTYGNNDAVDTVYQYSGWIYDVRITKAARYTATFTPPPDILSSAYALSGTVRDATGALAARKVVAYREDTNALVATTVSDGTTGAYTIPTEHPGEHTVVAYPVTGENLPALVHHGVIPI